MIDWFLNCLFNPNDYGSRGGQIWRKACEGKAVAWSGLAGQIKRLYYCPEEHCLGLKVQCENHLRLSEYPTLLQAWLLIPHSLCRRVVVAAQCCTERFPLRVFFPSSNVFSILLWLRMCTWFILLLASLQKKGYFEVSGRIWSSVLTQLVLIWGSAFWYTDTALAFG